MLCSRSKPGSCHHLSFATNPVLISWGKVFMQFEILVSNYSARFNFLKKQQSTSNFKTYLKLCKISTFNFCFLNPVIS